MGELQTQEFLEKHWTLFFLYTHSQAYEEILPQTKD